MDLIEGDHIHVFNPGDAESHGIFDIRRKNDGFYLNIDQSRQPIQTLKGLYSTLGDSLVSDGNVSERLEAMIGELEKHKKVEEGEELGQMDLAKELTRFRKDRLAKIHSL